MHTGIQWEYLPQELGFSSGITRWRRLAAWSEAGVWDQLHVVLLEKLRSKNQLVWSRVVIVSRPRLRPDALLADRGYEYDLYRRLLWHRGIRPVIAERGQPHGSGLGIFRYVVERTIVWLHGFRHLRIRWERRDDTHEASSASLPA
ncbi:transposase [Streptomyces alboniger]|uniref:Transposase n=1 Tax=Streptomyces alboniger TaxID=132473 RepID=A0A5J6HDZ8_STRAD|nr:transposase [Streptomyces alboniger]